MTTTSTSIFADLAFEPLTIKEIASAIEKSEFRTRELVKAAVADGSLEAHDTRPATFSRYYKTADAATLAAEAAMDDAEIKAWNDGAATPEAPEGEDLIGETELPIEINPFAALDFTHKEVADAVNAGLEAGQAEIEGREPVLLQDMIAALPKAKKAPLNPQPAIDKKVAIMEAAGGSITYAARTWTITDAGGNSITISSREFSLYKGEEILDVFAEARQATDEATA
jgi:hypothetical protein